jgi:MoaA/NifB/PqqE/SkfB family radical SAM enzyme
MRIEQYYRFFDELRDLGTMNLTLSGGEPLAHPDFFPIGRRAKELGFVVRIKSNGHALRGRLAERVKEEIDPFVVDISLHGANAESHDRQTRIEGSFDRLMANIPELLDRGFRLKANCTLTRWNEGEIEEIFELADRLGVRLSFNPNVSPRDDGDQEPLSLEASREAKQRLFEIQAMRASGDTADDGEAERSGGKPSAQGRAGQRKNCGAGSSGVAVDPYGNVLPCVQWRRPIGNLHRQSIREIWEGVGEVQEIRRLTFAAGAMVDSHGPDGRLMNFCPGMAQNYNGDPLAVYPSAREQMSVLQEIDVSAIQRRRRVLP